MRPRVYVAGPISCGDLKTNVSRAFAVGRQLVQAGFSVFMPHWSCFDDDLKLSIEANNSGVTYSEWMEVALAMVERSDAVLRLPGKSRGADVEVKFAGACMIPVFFSIPKISQWAIKTNGRYRPSVVSPAVLATFKAKFIAKAAALVLNDAKAIPGRSKKVNK
jgi:hypothetical protein